MSREKIRQAARLLKEGQKEQARQVAEQILSANRTYGPAWVVIAQVSTDTESRLKALERAVMCYELEPTEDNKQAAAWAEARLEKKRPGESAQVPSGSNNGRIPGFVILGGAGIILILLLGAVTVFVVRAIFWTQQ